MALSFSKTSDAVHKKLSVMIYGTAGIGKTTLVTTLGVKDDSRVFYISADAGQLALREYDFMCAEPMGSSLSPEDLELLYDQALKGVEAGKLDWIVIDGLDEVANDVLTTYLNAGGDGRAAYGDMGRLVEGWCKKMRSMSGVNVLFITHIDSYDDGGVQANRPLFPGNKLKNEAPGWFDLIGCMRSITDPETLEKTRLIQFNPDAQGHYMCKDRSGVLDDFEQPNLKDIYEKIHGQIKKEKKK